jgi:hypothetical protein
MEFSAEECVKKVTAGQMTVTEARNELARMEQLMGYVCTCRQPVYWNWNLTAIQEEEGISMAEQVRIWEQDKLRKMPEEHERSSRSSHVDVGGSAAQELDQWTRDFVRQLENIMGWPPRGMIIIITIIIRDISFGGPAHPAGCSRSCKKLNF